MKNSYLIVLILLFISINIHAQNYSIGHISITVVDSTRSNRSIPLEIYYPADTNGDNVSLSADAVQFPVLSFGHGFVMAWSAYQNIWEAVVPNGYIIAFPKTETGFSPVHLEFGKDLAFTIQYLQQQGLNSGSVFFNRISSASCVMGHSMGGGASFLAVQFVPQVTAIANFAPAETNPSAIAAASAITIPALIISGEKDCVTPPATNQIPMYDALSSTCKTMAQITGGIHCQMANANVLCNLGEASCIPSGILSESAQHSAIERLLIPWLATTLKNDCPGGITVDSLIQNDAAFSFTNVCQYCSLPTALSDLNSSISVTPNPFNESLTVSGMDQEINIITLFSIDGKKSTLPVFRNGKNVMIKTGELEEGFYLLKIGSREFKLLKK